MLSWHYLVMETDKTANSLSGGASDAEVLAAVAAGDADALGVLWRRHAAAVVGFCIRRCATADDVADAAAETFLAAWRAAGGYRPETDTAAPWLLGIARHVVARQHRRVAVSLRLAERLIRRAEAAPRFAGEEYEAVDAAVDAAKQAPAIAAALRALPAREREVLELVAYDQLEPAEAARVLGVSPNAARLRLSRARRRLQERLPEMTADRPTSGGPDGTPLDRSTDPRHDHPPGDPSHAR